MIRRLGCDGTLVPIWLGGDHEVLAVGRHCRLATRAQRRALRAMYRTCAFPHCTVGFNTAASTTPPTGNTSAQPTSTIPFLTTGSYAVGVPSALAVRTLTAREYLRVSLDRSGRERSIDEQHADNGRWRTWGWVLGEPYRDIGSASRYARRRPRRVRPAARRPRGRPLRRRAARAVGVGRVSRRVSEWVELIELCERRGVRIAVTTHGPRTYDPSNARDSRNLLEDAVDSEYETWKMCAPAAAGLRRQCRCGRPHGRVPYGYRRVYDPGPRRCRSGARTRRGAGDR